MTLTRESLLDLIDNAVAPAVTIAFPTFRAAPETQQNRVRYKNLLRDAEVRLGDADMAHNLGTSFSEARSRGEDAGTFAKPLDGMALFLAEGLSCVEKLTFSPPESVHVGDTFAVRPFFHLFAQRQKFLLLAAAYNDVQLYESDGLGLKPVEEEGFRETIDGLLAGTEIDNSVGFHPTARAAGGMQAAKFHALGESPGDTAEDLRKEFAARIARMVDSMTAKRNQLPAVIIADDRLLGEIQAKSKTQLVSTLDTRVPPGELSEDELLMLANGAMAEKQAEHTRRRLEAFTAAFSDTSSEQASTNPPELVLAAIEGRIQTLFCAQGAELRGDVDEATASIRHAGQKGDLIDALARITVKSQGEIIETAPGILPNSAPVAALYRW